jgi:hypothetical protein
VERDDRVVQELAERVVERARALEIEVEIAAPVAVAVDPAHHGLVVDGVGGEERERRAGAQLAPALLDGERGVPPTVAPEQAEQLAVDAERAAVAAAGAQLVEVGHDEVAEALAVGRAVDEDGVERLARVEQPDQPDVAGAIDVERAGGETIAERRATRLGGDDQHGVPGADPRPDEPRDRVGDERLALWVLNDVVRGRRHQRRISSVS